MSSEPKLGGDVVAALSLAGALIVVGSLAGDTTLGVLVTLIVTPLIAYAQWRVPIRQSMMTLMLFMLVLPNPADCTPSEEFRAPLYMMGAIVMSHLNTIDRSITLLSSCSFSGLDLCLLNLTFVALYRRSTGSRIDKSGLEATPVPMTRLAWIALGGILVAWLTGMVRGGEFRFSLWQLSSVIYLPVAFLLFQLSLRGPKDLWSLARIIMVSGLYKAVTAIYVYYAILVPPDPVTGSTHLATATGHSDSILFADAVVLMIACLLERAGKRTRWIAALCLPVLFGGMVANNRRLVWVQVLLVLVTVYLVAKDNPVKKAIRRSLPFVTPLIIGYIIAGWDSGGGKTFKPVRMLRSVVDAEADASTLWREFENYNLISTFRLNPLLGTGFGNGYVEFAVLPAIPYDLERYVPHNSLLGVWCYCGYFGYATITMLWVVGVYFAMRSYYVSANATHRAAALVSFGSVLVYLMQCWGDLGLGSSTGVFTVAPALAIAGKLAVANGQWLAKPSRSKPQTTAPA